MRPNTLLAMDRGVRDALLEDGAIARLSAVATVNPDVLITADHGFAAAEHVGDLAAAEILFTHWGCPPLTPEALALLPSLRAVVHAAGSVKHHVTDAVWQRGVLVSTAAAANAKPVAEYTLAAILFTNKRVLTTAAEYRQQRGRADGPHAHRQRTGNYQRVIGIVGASHIGRLVIELLRPFDMDVLVYDPYLDADAARGLGVTPVGLDELARRSDVVSIHAPQLPETRHMFDARLLGLMPDGSTLINTARGSLVDTAALTGELLSGRLYAVLDVTEPEVLPAGSPLYDLPNVLLTPHIAGSLGNELGRMADAAIDEVARFAQGEPLRHPVAPDLLRRSA